MRDASPKPSEKNPGEKNGWNLMVAGLLIVLSAGAAYYLTPKGFSEYRTLGNYLMAGGLAVYLTGRIVRARGKRSGASKGGKK